MAIVAGIAFAIILLALACAGVFMIRGGKSGEGAKSGAMMRALAVRIAVSVALFAAIVAAWALGWIHPAGVPIGR